MTQQNAALGQETNAKIEQTERQTNELDTLVEVFILAEVPGKLRPRSSSHRRLDRDDRRRRGAGLPEGQARPGKKSTLMCERATPMPRKVFWNSATIGCGPEM